MANVTVGSVSVSVLLQGGVDHAYQEYGGDRVRMEDGSLRVTVKGVKNQWSFVTTLLDAAAAAALETAIFAAPPITCSGDALGASFSCAGIVQMKERVSIAGAVMYRVHFSLWEI